MKREISKIVQKVHQDTTGAKLDMEAVSLLMYASRNVDINFVFINKESYPHYVIKYAKDDVLKQQLHNEYGFLSRIHTGTEDLIKNCTPEPLTEGTLRDTYFVVESAVNGVPLNKYLLKKRNSKPIMERLFAQVTEWLTVLYASSDAHYYSAEELAGSDHVLQSLKRYEQQHELSSEENKRILNILDRCASLTVNRIPLGISHGDFSPWNMRFHERNDNMIILDWEYAQSPGLPIIDLLNFFTVSQSVLSGFKRAQKNKRIGSSFSQNINIPRPELHDFQMAFYEDSWQMRLMQRCIIQYYREVGIDSRFLEILFLLFITNHLYYNKDFLTFFLQEGIPLSLQR